ncbi:bacteriophage tail sheath protein [Myxococcus stipitatus DSM 14675]|uniref:Bacteriophage tail sheath protein n=1 Tax=Myxococcus stipitatus (strain DSM 14675 / JCM 12634 / Mx s8) TaxID=1278073 RepID=L7U6P2_MYXSD|nr:phage tail sheath subtilisin-like domain-containing protein [Myxococcus stipitatus]AGC43257.1 bacteriophage tail sheath protein [Myxococcus stipitatus DSM 14675]
MTFNTIPAAVRAPWVAVEFDSSRSSQGSTEMPYAALIAGQKTTGTWAANTYHRVSNADQVAVGAGRGSQLHRQARAWFRNNTTTELWVGVLEDNASGVAATCTVTVTGTATENGALSFRVGGQLVQVPVAAGDAQNAVAANTAAAFPSVSDLPVTGVAATNVVTLTSRGKGTWANDIDVRLNYSDGEKTPAGLTVVITPMASGATNPLLTSLIAALGDKWFNIIVHPYTDATSLTAIETELARRFGPMTMIDGMAFTSAAGTVADLTTLGNSRNSPHSCVVAQPGDNPLTPPDEFAAAVAAVAAFHGAIDPARPFQTLPVVGTLQPAEADLFTFEERNGLLYDGIATTRTAAGGIVQLERLITTYQTNASGGPDRSYLDVTRLLTLMYLRYDFRTTIQGKYARHKLGNDGGRYASGQPIITPSTGRAEAVAWFRRHEAAGLVEDFDQFLADLVCERDTNDPSRLNWYLAPNMINQFIFGAAKISFID